MSNANAPFGLRPIGVGGGGQVRINSFRKYYIASGYNTSLGKNAPVVLTSAGGQIALGAGTGELLVGSFVGVNFTPSGGAPRFRTWWDAGTVLQTGTVAEALVADDPECLFEIQGDSTAVAAANDSLNADYTPAAIDSATKSHQSVLAGSSLNTTAGLMLAILGLATQLKTPTGKPEWGAYAPLVVRINQHKNAPGVAGV